MPDMVSAVTVTVPPKTEADFFPAFVKRTQAREIEKRKAKYFKATSDHFWRSKFDTLPRRCFDLLMSLELHQNRLVLTAPSVGTILILQGVFRTKRQA